MKRSMVVAGLLLCSGSAFADGPFCVFGSGPPQCFYYDVQSCRNAASFLPNAMCGANPQVSQQPSRATVQPIYQNIGSNMFRTYTEGVDARSRQDESALRQQLLRQQIAANARSESTFVAYRCPTANGDTVQTLTPAVGCVVEFVSPP